MNGEKVSDIAFCHGQKLFYYIRLKIVFRLCIFFDASTQKEKSRKRLFYVLETQFSVEKDNYLNRCTSKNKYVTI